MTDDKIIDITTGKRKVGGRKRPPGPGGGHKVKMGNSTTSPAKGPGWGGSAKGTRESFTSESASLAGALNSLERRAEKERRADELQDLLYEIARDPNEQASSRIAAINSYREGVLGKPVTRSINLNGNHASLLTDDELRAELDRITALQARS